MSTVRIPTASDQVVDESRGVLAADMLVWYHFPVWKTTICSCFVRQSTRCRKTTGASSSFGTSAILGIEPKAASIRYVRALEKLEKKLMELSCFGKG